MPAFSSGSDSKSYKQQWNHSIVIKAANTSYTPSPQAGPSCQPSAWDQTQSPTSNNGIILLLSRQQTRVTHHLLKQVLRASLQLGIRLKVLQATMESFYCYQGSKHELHTISSSRSFVPAFSSGSDSKSYKKQWNHSIVIKAANTSYTPSPLKQVLRASLQLRIRLKVLQETMESFYCYQGSKHELHTISSSRSFVAAFSSGSDSKSYKQQGNHSIVIKAANTSYTPSPQAGPLWQPSAQDQTQSPTSNNGIILLLSRQQTRVTHHLLKQVLSGSLQLRIRLKVLQETMESFYCYQEWHICDN